MSGRLRWLAVLLGLLVTSDVTAEETRPNIVLILVDDLGWADIGCYGADLHETPNIDRLAEQGMRFTDAYAAAAICSPTRASIMSGKYPARLNFTIWHEYAKNPPPSNHPLNPAVSMDHLAREEFTVAEALKEVGYNTLHVGKWHLGDAAYAPESHGFDVNIGGTHWGAPTTFHWPYRGLFGSEREWRYVPDLPFGQEGEYLTDRLTDEALRLIERVKDEPFYLNLWFHTVHTPIEAKAEDIAEYEGKLQEDFHHQNPTYAAMVHSLDENVGRVVHKLDELGLSEDTILIFTSDNGGTIREYDGLPVTTNHPLRSGKGSLYEGGLRVPFIVDWPGVTHADTVCDQMVCSTDLYPTILSMAGTTGDPAYNQTVDGIDLTGLLRDPSTSLDRETLYFHYPHYYPTTTPVSAIRDGDWKLLEYFEDGHTELYNLADDLGEEHDLSTSVPALTSSLHQKLVDWRESVGARLPTKRE